MNRRGILQLFGLGGVAAVLPTVSAPAAPTLKSIEHPLHRQFLDPMYAHLHMKGGNVYRARVTRHPDIQTVKLSFPIWHSGILEKLVIVRQYKRIDGGVVVVTMGPESFNTPFLVNGSTCDVEINSGKII